MGSRYFQNRARRTYWSVHIEAWRLSGLTRIAYCREHRLDRQTFGRWLDAIGDADALQHKPLRQKKRPRRRFNSDVHNKAVQAFWAMHVEALHWSGLSAAEYARAHRLTPTTLREWRGRLSVEPLGVDWRELVHPSARPYVGSRRSTGAKHEPAGSALTAPPTSVANGDGRSNRRSFSDEEKLALVLEAEAPGATVSQVARRHGIVTSMLFRWRVQFGFGKSERTRFANVRLAGDSSGRATKTHLLETLLPIPQGAVAVDLADGRRVFAPPGSDPEAVRQYVAERERAR